MEMLGVREGGRLEAGGDTVEVMPRLCPAWSPFLALVSPSLGACMDDRETERLSWWPRRGWGMWRL